MSWEHHIYQQLEPSAKPNNPGPAGSCHLIIPPTQPITDEDRAWIDWIAKSEEERNYIEDQYLKKHNAG